jgi:hypothetical protein
MRSGPVCFPVLITLALGLLAPLAAAEPQPLFNRNNLDGWEIWVDEAGPAAEPASLFRNEDGVIHVYPTQTEGTAQPFAGLVTRRDYSRYVLRLEYRWGTTRFAPRHDSVRDSGILFHVYELGRIWPASVECQVQEGDTGDIWTIGTRTTTKTRKDSRNYGSDGVPETRGGKDARYARFGRSYCWERPGWNELEITVNGPTAVYRLNGKVVNEVVNMERWNAASGSYEPLTTGRILLQAEGAEIFYRNVTLQEMSP